MRKKIYCPECTRLAKDMQNFMIEIRDHLKMKKAQKEKSKKNLPDNLTKSDDIRGG